VIVITQYPALLADINANHVAFSVFDGDLKAGADGACTNALQRRPGSFNVLKRPLGWLPGDSELDRLLGPLAGGLQLQQRKPLTLAPNQAARRIIGREQPALTC
jgi:hypothetical protein